MIIVSASYVGFDIVSQQENRNQTEHSHELRTQSMYADGAIFGFKAWVCCGCGWVGSNKSKNNGNEEKYTNTIQQLG